MKIIIDKERDISIEVEVQESPLVTDIANELAKTDLIKEIFKDVGKNSGFEAFPYENDISLETANDIAQAYFDGGIDRVHELYTDENWINHASYSNIEYDLRSKLSGIIDTISDQLDIRYLDDLIFDALLEHDDLREIMYDAMYEADTSTPEDSLPSHIKAEITFIPDNHLLAIDDMYPSHTGHSFSAEDARPSSSLMRILRFFNVSPAEFVDECKKRGWDPTIPDVDENMPDYRRKNIELDALTWKSILEISEGTTNHIRELPLSDKYQINEWNSIVSLVKDGKDLDKPAVVDMDTLFTILDNATYGGVPCFSARVPVKDILNGALDKPFKVTGGQIGVHDFINGSGYVDTLQGELTIDPSKGKISTSSIDDVYGMVGSAYNVDITDAEVTGWVRAKENQWLKIDGDRTVKIERSTSPDGNDKFWVTTMNEFDEAAGPRATAEVLPSLEEAKADGDACLQEEWELTTAPSL